MDGWALAVSFLALVIAIASAWFAYQEKEAVRSTLDVERQRLTDERTPSFDATVQTHRGGDGRWYRLTLLLQTPWTLSKMHVSLPPHHGISFTPSQRGVNAGAAVPILSVLDGPLDTGRELSWRVELDDERSAQAHLHIKCSDKDGRHWTVATPVVIPPSLPPVVG